MKVFLNGQFVPAEQAVVSAFDRGFLYGDGLFETLRVMNGVPLDWGGHWRRLADGAEMLKLKLPFASDFLRAQARELSRQNELSDAILRLTLSRGVGQRGYSPRGADAPTFVMSLHPAPELGPQTPQWKLHTASLRVPFADALTACKSANKLLHVLARAEAEAAGADEALLLNTRNEVVEAASANVFWIEGGALRCQRPPPVQVSDTTGAGDAFHGAYALAVARGETVLDALRFATAVAAAKCTRPGGRAGLPDQAALADFLHRHPLPEPQTLALAR